MKKEIKNNQNKTKDDKKVHYEETIQNTKPQKKRHIFICILLLLFIIFCSCIGYLEYLTYEYVQDTKVKIKEINEKAFITNEEIIEYGSILSYQDIYNKVVNENNLYRNTSIKIYMDNLKLNNNENKIFDLVSENYIKVIMNTNVIELENKYPKYSKIFNYLKKVIPFLNEKIELEKTITWKTQDTKKPTITGVSNKTITQGDQIDLKQGITASDEIDGNIDFTIEGNVDTNKAGDYKILVKAIDKNGNETTSEFKVTVKKKEVAKKATTSKKTTTTKKKTTSKSSSSSTTKKPSSSSSKKNDASTKAGRLALAKAEAKRVVAKIIKPGMTKYEKAEAICNYITTTVARQPNQSNEAYKKNYGNEAYAALVMKIAACSGRCKAVTLLCDAAGLKSKHVNANTWSHQWNKIQIDDGSWIVVDSQIGFIGKKHPLE